MLHRVHVSHDLPTVKVRFPGEVVQHIGRRLLQRQVVQPRGLLQRLHEHANEGPHRAEHRLDRVRMRLGGHLCEDVQRVLPQEEALLIAVAVRLVKAVVALNYLNMK